LLIYQCTRHIDCLSRPYLIPPYFSCITPARPHDDSQLECELQQRAAQADVEGEEEEEEQEEGSGPDLRLVR
jgi:hypothetical protein